MDVGAPAEHKLAEFSATIAAQLNAIRRRCPHGINTHEGGGIAKPFEPEVYCCDNAVVVDMSINFGFAIFRHSPVNAAAELAGQLRLLADRLETIDKEIEHDNKPFAGRKGGAQ